MGDTPAKRTVKQSIVDFQETNNLYNVTDPNSSPTSSSDHEGMLYIYMYICIYLRRKKVLKIRDFIY